MGDLIDNEQIGRGLRPGETFPSKPVQRSGLTVDPRQSDTTGHNGGPPLDEAPGFLWRLYCWSKAYDEAWRPPAMAVLKFRMARAAAAGLSYHDYMLQLLDTGRHAQKDDATTRSRPSAAKPVELKPMEFRRPRGMFSRG